MPIFKNICTRDPLIINIFAPGPATLVYNNTLFLYRVYHTAYEKEIGNKMPDRHVFSSTDLLHWKDYGACLSPNIFSWITVDADAAQYIYRNDEFYGYVSVPYKTEKNRKEVCAFGITVSGKTITSSFTANSFTIIRLATKK